MNVFKKLPEESNRPPKKLYFTVIMIALLMNIIVGINAQKLFLMSKVSITSINYLHLLLLWVPLWILLWIIVASIEMMLLVMLSWINKYSTNLKTFFVFTSPFLAIIFTYWIFLWQISILPKDVTLQIDLPDGRNEVRDLEDVQVTFSPYAERAYILIHPHPTQNWYIFKPIPDKNKKLKFYKLQFGTIEIQDCNEKFDIIALASRDSELIDEFRGRIINIDTADMLNSNIPPLNRSVIITVTKICE